MTWTPPVRIVGIGSPLGDDALGWEVVRAVRVQMGPRSAIDCQLVEGGQRLLDILDGRGTLVLVDALAGSGSSGNIRCFEWPDPRFQVLRPGSTHDLTPAEALALAEPLGLLPPTVRVYAIEGESFGPSQGLSTSVAAAVTELARKIVGDMKR